MSMCLCCLSIASISAIKSYDFNLGCTHKKLKQELLCVYNGYVLFDSTSRTKVVSLIVMYYHFTFEAITLSYYHNVWVLLRHTNLTTCMYSPEGRTLVLMGAQCRPIEYSNSMGVSSN